MPKKIYGQVILRTGTTSVCEVTLYDNGWIQLEDGAYIPPQSVERIYPEKRPEEELKV